MLCWRSQSRTPGGRLPPTRPGVCGASRVLNKPAPCSRPNARRYISPVGWDHRCIPSTSAADQPDTPESPTQRSIEKADLWTWAFPRVPCVFYYRDWAVFPTAVTIKSFLSARIPVALYESVWRMSLATASPWQSRYQTPRARTHAGEGPVVGSPKLHWAVGFLG